MARLFHFNTLMSMAALALAASASTATPAGTSPYFGRWTVSDDKPVYTAKGREYKTIDIAPCGKDFCGVSVGDKVQCGPTLFRFLMAHAIPSEAGTVNDELHGHAKWGGGIKNTVIVAGATPPSLQVDIGDGYVLGDRGGNMPKFQATYRRLGNAACHAR